MEKKKRKIEVPRICLSFDNFILDSMQDTDVDDDFEMIDNKIDNEILLQKVYTLIETKFTFRERQVFSMFYGICGEDSIPVKSIASILRITESTVYKTLKKATIKLQDLIDE